MRTYQAMNSLLWLYQQLNLGKNQGKIRIPENWYPVVQYYTAAQQLQQQHTRIQQRAITTTAPMTRAQINHLAMR